MEKIIILNHKMNLEYDQTYEYIEELNKLDTTNNIIICPSNIYLESFITRSAWGIGAQNVSEKINANETGEISSLQLKSLGVEYCIVGHYERVKYFHETPKIINKKIIACLESNIMPIVCFGSSGKKDKIEKELDELCREIEHIEFIIFAYEPLELNFIPSIDTIEEDINFIYDYLQSTYHVRPKIVFGGGVRQNNIKNIMKLEKVSGVIIGEISKDINEIKKIINKID